MSQGELPQGGASSQGGSREQRGQRSLTVPPFTVEFGDIYNRTQTINCLRLRVRGSWSLAKLHARPEGGRDVGNAMTAMPDIPGQRLTVYPKKMVAVLNDPLEDDKAKLDRINQVVERARSIYKGAPFTFVPRSEIQLSPDLLKTLCIELARKIKSESCAVIEGKIPDAATIERMEGRELFDPWNNGRKPVYVDEVNEWEKRLDEQQV